MTEKELLSNIQVNTAKDTYVIEIGVTNEEPQKAMEIAKEISNVFLEEIKGIYRLDNIGIVDEAQLPKQPYNINHKKDIIMFLAIGMMVVAGYTSIVYLFDNTLKTEEDIEKYIDIKSLGIIPIHEEDKKEILDRKEAKSYITECINTIRTNILYRNTSKNAKTILITSCTPREGKSWVSANMAVAFAQTNQKVLLIDADMRKGRTHKIFKIKGTEGLSNYLYHMTGEKEKDIKLGKQYIRESDIANLHILTNGTIPPNPSELLDSEKMKELIGFLKKMYDIIIVDAPPCRLVTDSMILSTIIDSTVLVVNAGKTKINDLKEVKKSIQTVGGKIIGAILNKKKVSEKTYSTKYYYGHVVEKENQEEIKQEKLKPIDEVIKEAILNVKEEDSKKNKKENKLEEKEAEIIKDNSYEEISKIDYTKQIEKITQVLDNLKNNYQELAIKIEKQEEKEETIQLLEEELKQSKEKSKNIIDFKLLQKQKEKKKTYSIEEDISYEDLEENATYVIPLHKETLGSYQKIISI